MSGATGLHGHARILTENTVTRPAITSIAGIGLAAQSLPADRAFYEKTLGWIALPIRRGPNGLRFYGVPKQWVEVLPATSADEHPFRYVAFATTDAKRMRLYLAEHGVTVPASVTRWSDGSQGFRVKDPEGNTIEFIQRGPLPAHSLPIRAPSVLKSFTLDFKFTT